MIYPTPCEHANKYTTEVIPCHTLSPLNIKGNYIFLQDLPPKLYDGAENPVGLLSLFCPNANTPVEALVLAEKQITKDFRPYPFNFFLFVITFS
jgi:hypothetical protein